MTVDSALLREYVEHLHARIRARSTSSSAPLPDRIRQQCAADPRACLELVVAALQEATTPHVVHAIGDGLLEDLLNEHTGKLFDETVDLLRNNQRFRFAFASGTHSSVDPSVISDWVELLKRLGTTKQAERKKLWRPRALEPK
jgi:hypothetical protein